MFLFLTEQKKPFEVHQPNKESSVAIEELENGKGSKFNSVDELMADLEDESGNFPILQHVQQFMKPL